MSYNWTYVEIPGGGIQRVGSAGDDCWDIENYF